MENTDDICLSFFNLINGDGRFKSEQQAKFLLSQCVDGMYTFEGKHFRNAYCEMFRCDGDGVVSHTHYTHSKGNVLMWQRRIPGGGAVQDVRETKRLQRLLKQAVRELRETDEANARGEYDGFPTVYESTVMRHIETISQLTEKLEVL